jgi:hypothetical protein
MRVLPERVESVSSWWFCDVAAPLIPQDSIPLGTEKDISIKKITHKLSNINDLTILTVPYEYKSQNILNTLSFPAFSPPFNKTTQLALLGF